MSSAEAWKQIIARRGRELIGGYFKHFAHGEGIYLGPVKDLKVQGNHLIVTTAWTSHTTSDGMCKKVTGNNANTFRLDISHPASAPEDDNNYVVYGGFSKNGNPLTVWFLNKGVEEPGFDPSMVEGL
jgi:hypothetical protein